MWQVLQAHEPGFVMDYTIRRCIVAWYNKVMLQVHFICQPEDTLSAECNMLPDRHPAQSGFWECIKGWLWFGAAMAIGVAISALG